MYHERLTPEAHPNRGVLEREVEVKKITSKELRRYLDYRVAVLKKANVGLEATSASARGNRTGIKRFQRMRDLLGRVDFSEADEVLAMLEQARDKASEFLSDVKNEHYTDYLIQRTRDLDETI